MSKSTTHRAKGPPREKVLIVSYDDSYAEAFAAKHIDVKFLRCPAAFSLEGEAMAEDVVEQSLRPAWRKLYFPGFCRRSEMLRPLLPSIMQDAQYVRDLLQNLNSISVEAV